MAFCRTIKLVADGLRGVKRAGLERCSGNVPWVLTWALVGKGDWMETRASYSRASRESSKGSAV